MKIINQFFRLSIYLFTLALFYSPNIYNQILTPEQIYQKVNNTVVVIHAYNYDNELSKQGSGVVLNDKGYVVTNYHVLAGCDRLEILHNKEIIPFIDIIGIDVKKDILILKIEAKKFPPIKIGNPKKINIGQRVYAIGSPLGFENTISEGIISGLRTFEEARRNFIQITASISSGSSGGAVVNDLGELVGISTLTAKEGQNVNFAIPIEDVLKVEIGSYSKDDRYKDFEWFSKGLDAYEKGNYNEAIKYYTKTIEIFPNFPEPYNNRGLAKKDKMDFEGAIQDYNKAIQLNPDDAFAYNNRGLVKKELGDYNGAIQDYDKVIEINPNDVAAYHNRGNVKCELEDYEEAIEDYSKVIEINPNMAVTYYHRGDAKKELEDYKGAIQDYNKAIEINQNDEFSYNGRGIAKSFLEDYRGALQDFNKAIQLNTNYSRAYFNRGLVKFQLKDKSGACLDWSKAGELGIDNAYDMISKFCD